MRTRASIEALAADPARDAWQKPTDLLDKAEISVGARVVDLGAGNGYLLTHLSERVGPTGAVVAIEFEADLVAQLKGHIVASKLGNVGAYLEAEGVLPGSDNFDRVILLDSYGALAEPVGTLERIRTRLVVGGLLVIVGHKPYESVPGPPMSERLDAETILAEARGAGFAMVHAQHDLGRQWMVIFRNDPYDPASAPPNEEPKP